VLTTLSDSDVLERHGLRHDPAAPWMKENPRSLDEIDDPPVPRGYRLTTMAEYVDTAPRSAAHRSAFAPGSRFSDQVYAVVRATWPYRSDLDGVCVAPDVSVAAYTLAWLDEQNEIGELEPVGTHADHRRFGLARATSLFALRRLCDEGAKTALVACRGDGHPAASALYESIGFRERRRLVTFTAAG
jgi:GNAT superfamily N-acetyltransferase